jgi:DNA topoisomerase-1
VPREKVLAAAVRILAETLIRVGNEEYARANHSFGLTTLRGRHVDVAGSHLVLRFRGKGGIEHDVDIRDRRLAQVVERLQELPGQDLFQYLDAEDVAHPVGSDDVNAYLREISGDEVTAKDFRTWAGTVLAARALAAARPARNERVARQRVVRAIDAVAARLRNTRAVCRKCYVHPAVIVAYREAAIPAALRRPERVRKDGALSSHEAAVVTMLTRSARRQARRAA